MSDLIVNGRWERECPIDSLTRHPENPRRGDTQRIAHLIRVNGFVGYVVAQESTRHVLVGNHRLDAARIAGMTHVPAVFVDVDDVKAKKILLADNRTADLAWDDPATLSALLEELGTTGVGLEGTGFSDDEALKLLAQINPVPGAARELDPEFLAGKVKMVTCPACGTDQPA